jgi:hypothetical protein
MALTTDMMALALVQPLHGLTFAALHLACMRLLPTIVPQHLAATAQAMYALGAGATTASADFGKASTNMADKVGRLGSAVTGATTAIDSIGGSMQAIVDIQQASTNKASRLARALNDVKQAQEDYNQALLDGKQAQVDAGQFTIDAEQAALDAAVALKDYAAAVKEHGKNSDEAKQAQLDLKQAQQDSKQATVDAEQATRDLSQSQIDAEAAQLDLNDAQREAKPPQLQEWADKLALITPLLTAIVGVQWAWNIAMTANPIGLIIAGIVLLVGVIVLIATKTTWFQDAWKAAWGWIKSSASSVWDWLKEIPGKIGATFKKVSAFISWPFRTAFNLIADAWNNTIGRLSWSVPDWIPGIGGNTISVPNLPKFHAGGVVPGAPGQEVVAMLQAGERVTPAGASGGATVLEVHSGGTRFDDLLVEVIRRAVTTRGGNVQLVLGANRG